MTMLDFGDAEASLRHHIRRCHSFPVLDVAGDVVGQIDHADFHRHPSDADGSDEQAHPGLLVSEDMLNARSDL